jgi:hypothetical protein
MSQLVRDRSAERSLLDRSQGLARLSAASWPIQVEERLELGQALYGNAALSRPLNELLDEIAEEALDIGGWSCLAAAVAGDSGLDSDAATIVAELIAQAMGAAATAHAHVVAAKAAVRRAGQ